MNFLNKSFLVLGLCGLLLSTAACHKKDDVMSKDTLEAIKNGKRQTNEDATGNAATESTRNIAAMIKVLSQADNIFEQVWPHVWEEGAYKVNNVFKVSKLFLKIRFNDDGRVMGSNAGCSGYDISMRITQVTGNPKGKATPSGYSMGIKPCNKQEISNLMLWELDRNGQLRMQFETGHYPQGTGLSLKTMGRPVKCIGKIEPSNFRLDMLRCEGLGQNRSAQEYIEFTKLEFSRDAKMMVHVIGNRYKSLQELDRKIDLMVPLAGDIQVVERVIVDKPEPATTPALPMPTGPIKAHNEPVAKTTELEQKQTAAVDTENENEEAQEGELEGEEELQQQEEGQEERQYTEEEAELLKQGIPLDGSAEQQGQGLEQNKGQKSAQAKEQKREQSRGPVQKQDGDSRQDQEEPIDPAALN